MASTWRESGKESVTGKIQRKEDVVSKKALREWEHKGWLNVATGDQSAEMPTTPESGKPFSEGKTEPLRKLFTTRANARF